jgi:hypothetical protein
MIALAIVAQAGGLAEMPVSGSGILLFWEEN